jgi:signal transduction histidine kinase
MDADAKARSRFWELVAAIAVVVLALLWAERMAWNQITALRRDNDTFIKSLKGENAMEAQHFIATANQALTQLQRFLFVSFFGLLASGATIIVLAYRRMIAPMQTRLTQSQATIERQEKLASFGIFAAGIAHEIRNPLTAIKVRVFSLKQSQKPDSSEREDVEVIESEINRLERIVREFLQFARPAEPELETVSVRKVFEEIEQLLSKDFAQKGIDLGVRAPDTETIQVDPNKFKQALMNLVQNGAEAINGTGKVIVRYTKELRILHGRMRPVSVITISDTGSGFSLQNQKRMFDPFFTTKEKGTGLGLPIAARIIDKHGGAIECETSKGKGTIFSILLPRHPSNE